MYAKNDHSTDTMDGFKFWLDTDSPPVDTTIKWGFDIAGINGTAQVIADFYTAPVNVQWHTAGNEPTTTNVGKFKSHEFIPIWIWWHVEADAISRTDDRAIFNFSFLVPGGATPPPTPGTTVDDFGIRKIYVTATGGRVYNSNWHTASSHQWDATGGQVPGANPDPQDSLVDFVAPTTCRAIVDSTTKTLTADTNTDKNSWRYYIKDPDCTAASSPWKWSESVEVTVYYKAIKDYPGGTIHVHCRVMGPTEHWNAITDDNPSACSAAGHEYSYEIKKNGVNEFRKEEFHASVADGEGYAENIIFPDTSAPYNQWIGMKLTTQLIGTTMKIQAWKDLTDGAAGGTWIKAGEIVDDGTNWKIQDAAGISNYGSLPAGSGNCTKISPIDAVLSMDASAIGLRVDNTQVQFKKLSVREIDPDDIGSGGGGGDPNPPPPPATNVTYTYESKFGSQGSGDGQFLNPHDISFDATGNIFVCDRDRNDVQKFTHGGTFISKFGGTGSGNGQFNVPYAIQHTNDFSAIYVMDRGNNRIQKLDGAGAYISQITTANGQALNAPEDICFDTSGNFYVCDTGNNRIIEFNSSHTFIRQWGSLGSGNGQFDHPHSMDMGLDGNVYINSGNQAYIQVFTPTGVFIRKFSKAGTADGELLTFLEHLDIDTAGRLHIINNNARPVIQVFDCATGAYITKYGKETEGTANGQFKEPEHVTVYSDGKPHVVDSSNFRIQVFSVSSTTPPPPPNPPPTTIVNWKMAIAGDWGCSSTTNTVRDLCKTYDFTLGVGDNAYAAASCWTSAFASLKPKFNSAYGNHEYSESGGIAPYKTFFGHSLTYFSFDFQNVHILVLDTNISLSSGSAQHTFATADLTAQDSRNNIDWIIVDMHHPWYTPGGHHPSNEFNQVQAFHSLFTAHKVTFVVTGHNHNWQRTHQIAYSGNPSTPTVVGNTSPYSSTPAGLIHVVTGGGGTDTGSGLYTLGSQPAYQAFQNRTHNGIWEIVASNNAKTLTCSFLDKDGTSKFDTFVINTT